MQELIFIDQNGEQLIVRYRRSAVFFIRETDLSIEGYVSPYWSDKTPVFDLKEHHRKYMFDREVFNRFIDCMEHIGQECWKNFTPREADSFASDYDDYYDKEFGNNGSLSIFDKGICIEGPLQKKTKTPFIRLIKFNKRTFGSFVFDLLKLRTDDNGAATNNL